jgi:hypothetical protein
MIYIFYSLYFDKSSIDFYVFIVIINKFPFLQRRGDVYEGIEKSLQNQWRQPCRCAAAAGSARTISMMIAQ